MEDLLPYYERELVLLRHYGREFAVRFPKVAAQLGMGRGGGDDPQVERLVQSVALLAARVSKRLDDDYPQFTESLLEMLLPHYLRPFPACAVVCAEPAERGTHWQRIPRGTEMESVAVQGVRCKFRSAYDIATGPLWVTAAGYTALHRAPADLRLPAEAGAAIRITFEGTAACPAPVALRVFMDGEPSFCAALRDALFMHVASACVETEQGGWTALPGIPLSPVGFAEEDALIPFDSRSQPAYRLLTEYFAYPEKFNFFALDLAAILPHLPKGCGRFTLHLILSGVRPDSQAARMLQTLSAANMRLGCAPVVNLFSRPGEPIAVTQRSSDYPVVASAHHASAYEVYSVDSVRLLRHAGKNGTATEFRPFYSMRHGEDGAQQGNYWVLRHDEIIAAGSPGYEKRLSLVDADLAPLALGKDTLSLELTCTNRDLPLLLRDCPHGAGLTVASGAGGAKLFFALHPAPPLRIAFSAGLQWRLISHLALNHHTLTHEGLPAFREMLALYDLQQSATSQRQIAGITGLRHVPATAWLRHPRGASLAHGLEVRMTLDEDAFVGGGIHLFVQVIDHFLGMYAQVNSFIELVALSHKSGKELIRCKPRSGYTCLT
ncbi:type VI secretion protein [Massilia sp. Root418]|jgi:type VI secretion system protein ImpG|uniref:type VI secretion system baseplate subunit TssF n=1 Tax=Massilia sp. Root418 TaxID=1736532 RepID=UPI0006FF85D0|nr:type VI secretion system baseplate subunit TssF [Massilia sp. Root418]KQW89332.1 type VI secretion protein [Massilia sp. Root418]